MRIYTYVDNSNFFIEGQRASAVDKGMAMDIYDAIDRNVFDYSWHPDYGKLHVFVCGTDVEQIGGAHLWGSPPPGDSFWEMVKREGFQVKTYDRSASGKEKKVDVAIAHRMTKDAYSVIDMSESEITLVSGDKDYVPVVVDLVAEGFAVNVYFWDHAARELKEACTRFVSLNDHIAFLSR